MKAKFPGTCPLSGKPIKVGDEILHHNGQWALAEVARSESMPSPVKAGAVAHATINPSPQQKAVFSFVKDGRGNGAIVAVAGSGKTTTLLMAMQHVPHDASCAFVAFNRHIADELRSRCPKHVKVYTVHSLGLANIRQLWGDEDNPIAVDAEKAEGLMDGFEELRLPVGHLKRHKRAEVSSIRTAVRRLASMCKLTLTDPDPVSLQEMAWQYGIDVPADDDLVFRMVPQVLSAARERTDVVDFDDMLWLPIKANLPLKHFDFFFVDEAQDLNPLQLEFVMRSVRKESGRVLAVGDPRQSIFGWAGADVEAMPRLIDALGAYQMPLSVSYRCPTRHVDLARDLCPHMEARDDAPDGVVEDVTVDEFDPRPGDMVICRTNAPLIPHAFDCIRRGIKATVRGRDIGRQLAGLAAQVIQDAVDMRDAKQSLAAWHRKESSKLILREAPQSQLDSLNDRVMTIQAVMEECASPHEVPGRIERIFSDKQEGVLFSSVHRAKGLESERVWILRPEQLGRVGSNLRDWETEQEENVRYVALTRSKRDLYFVREPNSKSERDYID